MQQHTYLESTLNQLRRTQRLYLIAGVVALIAAPVVWIGVTVMGMAHVFGTIAETQNPTPDELAVGIRLAEFGVPVAFVLSTLGLVLIVVSLRCKRRLDDLEREYHDELTA
jgi:biopolymer transport protein ExbB/TolQ